MQTVGAFIGLLFLGLSSPSSAVITQKSAGRGHFRVPPIKVQTAEGTCECWSRTNAPKLTLVSVVVGMKPDYLWALRNNRFILANPYEYEYCEFTVDMDPSRAKSWNKIKAFQVLLGQGRQRLVFIDADAYFVKMRPFENVTQFNHVPIFELGKDVIVTTDHPMGDPCNLNTGVMITMNSNWSQQFWQSIWDRYGPDTDELGLDEQSALCLYRREHAMDFRQHVAIVDHKRMNDIGKLDGEYIVHMAGGGAHFNNLGKYDTLLPHLQEANERMMRGARMPAFFTDSQRTLKMNVTF